MPSSVLATLVARDVTVAFGATTVLDGVSVVVAPGDRIGVVGPNGTGKTTLLRTLAGTLAPDRGAVSATPPGASVGYLRQEPERSPTETVRDALARRVGVHDADAELEAATHALAAAKAAADERYSQALERWLALGGADLDGRVGEVWAELGLAPGLLDQPSATLSGGEAARAALASVLLSRHDILLLDEPTNDLDFAALARLERFVATREGGLVLVSHDRAFLERTITAVVELDEHARTARRFEGGWTAYLDERAVARRHAEEAWSVHQDKRSALSGRVQRQREWTQVGIARAKRDPDPDKNIRHHKKATSEKQAAKISQSERALERLDAEGVSKPWEGWDLRLELAEAPRSGQVVARLEGAVVERGGFRLGPVDLEVHAGDRIALVGPNGAGKSTLLAALLGRVPLAAGRSYLGPGVVVGEIDQQRGLLDGDGTGSAERSSDRASASEPGGDGARAQRAGAQPPGRSVLAAFQAVVDLPAGEVRTLLAKFGLGADHVVRPARSLSPGERTRAVLALLQARGTNCLVLDEPTNHLDMAAIEQLEQALEGFGGTVLVVTHDRRLLENVRTGRTLRVEGGRVSEGDRGEPSATAP